MAIPAYPAFGGSSVRPEIVKGFHLTSSEANFVHFSYLNAILGRRFRVAEAKPLNLGVFCIRSGGIWRGDAFESQDCLPYDDLRWPLITLCKWPLVLDAPMTPAPIRLKIQLLCGDEIAMGPGKADLLDRIVELGSISAAARAMEMSYRRAWLLVDAMNRCWAEAIVETSPGRAKAGSARITATGRHVLAAYRKLQAGVAKGAEYDDLCTLVREHPTPKSAAQSSLSAGAQNV